MVEITELVVAMAKSNPNYVNRADMWTWAGHASSCGSLSPRASHKFFPALDALLPTQAPDGEFCAALRNGLSNTPWDDAPLRP